MAKAVQFSEDTLNLVPKVAPGVEIIQNAENLAEIRIPRPRTRWMRFLCFIFKAPDYKMMVLDETGTEMLGLIDGRTTFRELAEHLRARHSLEEGQAQASLAAFLSRLAYERVILLAENGATQ